MFTGSFASNVGTSQHKHAKKLREVQNRKTAFMIELTLICMGMCNVHWLMNDQDSTWMSHVSGLRKERLPSLRKVQTTQSLTGVTCSLSLGVLEWTGPPQAGRLELILLGPWGFDLIPCLLSLRGRLWITPGELQLHSLHWTSCLLRGVIYACRRKISTSGNISHWRIFL